MKKSYYLFNPGRMSRKDNTLKFTPIDEEGKGPPKYIPVEDVDNLYIFGSIDTNSALYNFLGKQGVCVHFFDFYEHYTGSFMAKEYLLAGKMQVAQTSYYLAHKKRMAIAQSFVEGAAFNMLKNLRYYHNRGKDMQSSIERIEALMPSIQEQMQINSLMGIEGNIRMAYYDAFDTIINDFDMSGRSKQPPSNEVNALISFMNMLCYALCLDQIYHTQLNPTISFLHEPGARRYSLALDLSEIFKPVLVDKAVFSLFNKKVIQASDFEHNTNGCLLKPASRKKVLEEWDARLKETIKHRNLGKQVSYRYLVRLECYKLTKHLLGMETYKPFKAWW